MIIDGIILSLLAISYVCFYIAGYHTGKDNERKRNLNDLKARNDWDMEYKLRKVEQ